MTNIEDLRIPDEDEYFLRDSRFDPENERDVYIKYATKSRNKIRTDPKLPFYVEGDKDLVKNYRSIIDTIDRVPLPTLVDMFNAQRYGSGFRQRSFCAREALRVLCLELASELGRRVSEIQTVEDHFKEADDMLVFYTTLFTQTRYSDIVYIDDTRDVTELPAFIDRCREISPHPSAFSSKAFKQELCSVAFRANFPAGKMDREDLRKYVEEL